MAFPYHRSVFPGNKRRMESLDCHNGYSAEDSICGPVPEAEETNSKRHCPGLRENQPYLCNAESGAVSSVCQERLTSGEQELNGMGGGGEPNNHMVTNGYYGYIANYEHAGGDHDGDDMAMDAMHSENGTSGIPSYVPSTYCHHTAPLHPFNNGHISHCSNCGHFNSSDVPRYCDWCGSKPKEIKTCLRCTAGESGHITHIMQ